MLVIGLTGSFGTGKTTVCEILAELGATIIDADKLGHELLQTSSNVRDELIAAFGPDFGWISLAPRKGRSTKYFGESTGYREGLNTIPPPQDIVYLIQTKNHTIQPVSLIFRGLRILRLG